MKTFLVFALIGFAALRAITLPNESTHQIMMTGFQAGAILFAAVLIIMSPAQPRQNRKVPQRGRFATAVSRLIDGAARDVR